MIKRTRSYYMLPRGHATVKVSYAWYLKHRKLGFAILNLKIKKFEHF